MSRTRRRDEEAIIDKHHQSKSMSVYVGHQRECASRRGRLTRTSEQAGERKDSMVKINQEVNTIPSLGPKVLKTV